MTVKIIIEEPQQNEEEQIIVKCHRISPEILRLLNAFKTQQQTLIAYVGNEIHRVSPSNILYIESVDNKTFLYEAQNVFESKQKLYELEEALDSHDFLRISKSTIVNLSKVKSLVPAMSGRLEAILKNDEKVIIARQYVHAVKISLGI